MKEEEELGFNQCEEQNVSALTSTGQLYMISFTGSTQSSLNLLYSKLPYNRFSKLFNVETTDLFIVCNASELLSMHMSMEMYTRELHLLKKLACVFPHVDQDFHLFKQDDFLSEAD